MVLYENSCIESCPLDHIEISKICYGNVYILTLACHDECATCNGLSRTNCVSCKDGKFLLNGECLTECPSGYYLDSEECLPCLYPCATCESLHVCLTCLPAYHIVEDHCALTDCRETTYEDNSLCLPCSKACLTCYGSTNTECVECNYPEGYVRKDGVCQLITCMEGMYQDEGQCKLCGNLCKSCVNGYSCIECMPEALAITTNEGLTCNYCPEGYVFKQDYCEGNVVKKE